MSETESKPKILLQLDSDPQPSVFDAVVAADVGVDVLLRHGGIRPESVRPLVYGAIFTRALEDLHQTAIFVGGSDAGVADAVLREVCEAFVGPLRVSVMTDPNGANTTAAAVVLAAGAHVTLDEASILVLGSTGPVGRRVVHLLARRGARVRAASRSRHRAEMVCQAVASRIPSAQVSAWEAACEEDLPVAAEGVEVVIAAGAPGVQLMSAWTRRECRDLKVAVDLNAVPPVGLEGIDPMACGTLDNGVVCYGAIGIGSAKMKIHKAALRRLFAANDQVFDVEEIYEIALRLRSACQQGP